MTVKCRRARTQSVEFTRSWVLRWTKIGERKTVGDGKEGGTL